MTGRSTRCDNGNIPTWDDGYIIVQFLGNYPVF